MRSDRGIAIVIVLLVSTIALMAAVAAALSSTLTTRQTSASERRSTVALFAAESGLNTIVARSKSDEYELTDSDASISDWLARVGLSSYSLGGGTTVYLSVLAETASEVTIRSEGVAPDGSRRVVIQAYELGTDSRPPGLFANAALVTQGEFHSNSAKSIIRGRDSTIASWVFPDRQLWEAFEGEYFVASCGGTNVTYKVVDSAENPAADGQIDVVGVPAGSCPAVTWLSPSTQGTLIPFAVASALDSMGRAVGTATTQTIEVTDTTIYTPGTEIFIGNGEATVDSVGDGTLTITWKWIPSPSIPEATPIRQHIPAVIAEGSKDGTNCPAAPGESSKFPEGCYFADLSNIWEKTFPGISKGEMLDLAIDNAAHYGPNADSDWPSSNVSGVTWIDGAQTGDFNGGGGKGKGKGGGGSSGGALCGEGIVILNTGVFGTDAENASINLNVSGCEFKGILYVIGDLGIEGNLESFSGTIIVETGIGTRVQGNGEKSFYDPVAIRRALAGLPNIPAATGFIGPITSSWRFGE